MPRAWWRHLALVAAAAAPFLAATAAAQESHDWRTIEASRALAASASQDTLRVRVAYSVGTLSLGEAASGVLYDLVVRYDADERRVGYSYEQAARLLTIGGDSGIRRRFAIPRDDKRGGPRPSLALRMAPGVPLDLAVRFSAADAALDLGGLAVGRLSVDAVASGGKLTFARPNSARISTAELRATVAGLDARQLGNAHLDTVRARATLGHVELDLDGDWTGSTALDLDAVLGVITVRVPSDAGVKVDASTTFGSVETPGFTARDGALYSDNWATAARQVTIAGRAIFARLEIERIQ